MTETTKAVSDAELLKLCDTWIGIKEESDTYGHVLEQTQNTCALLAIELRNRLTAPSPAVAEGWQPIETAPKGKSLICYWPAVQRDHVQYESYIGQAWCRFGNWFKTRDGYGEPNHQVSEPACWISLNALPAAPSAASR